MSRKPNILVIMPDTFYMRILRENGYRTAHIGKSHW